MSILILPLILSAAAVPLNGEYNCGFDGDIIAGAVRTQTGESSIDAMAPQDFRYGDFSFVFEGDAVLVRLRVGEERKEQSVPYLRRKSYVTFNYNQGLDETGWAQPITFWSNEAGLENARYSVSFPSVSMRVMKTISGAEVHLGDGAMAVAALTCTKRAS